ncbi:elongator complex protein 6 isoform X1 [Typha angustifolia]|uniref:elongator complex protein 6 isoform X1 n=1 Tax=Typha angustifolia TaxID=59011 RepID=UPI003C30A7A1
MAEFSNLLDEAMGLGAGVLPPGCVVLVEDCVETSGAFLLHHLLKRALFSEANAACGGAVVFLAVAQTFFHYDRVLRKLGCNLVMQKKNNKLHFIDLLEFPVTGVTGENASDQGFVELYSKIRRAVQACCSKEYKTGSITIMIDDISLLEIAAHGSMDVVLDFLHYCVTLASEMECSLVILNHEDIYSSEEAPGLLSHLRHLSDVEIKAAPLSTGLAADVHGQLTIVNKGKSTGHGRSAQKVRNFHFKVKENGVEFFYPGSRH